MFEQTIKLNIITWKDYGPISVNKLMRCEVPEDDYFGIEIKQKALSEAWGPSIAYIRVIIFFERNIFGVQTFYPLPENAISFDLLKPIEPLKLDIQAYYIENYNLIIKVIETENELPIQLESNERKLLK